MPEVTMKTHDVVYPLGTKVQTEMQENGIRVSIEVPLDTAANILEEKLITDEPEKSHIDK